MGVVRVSGTISIGAHRGGAILEGMQSKPNKTLVEGTVRSVRPDAGGYGSNVEIEVSGNVSPVEDADFLKPQRGDRLTDRRREDDHDGRVAALPQMGQC